MIWLLLVLNTFVFEISSATTIRSQDVLTSANRAIRREDQIELEGDVQLIFQDQHLSANFATVNTKDKTVIARGDVIFVSDNGRVEAEEIHWDYKTNRGVFYRGFIESGQVFFEADRIEKIGDHEYLGEEAFFTACTTCPAGWSFNGRRIQAELGGYAHISRPLIRIATVPVLWLPYLVVPLKSQRQSGLLWPSFGNEGQGGFALAQSFFWAINRSQDATFTSKYYVERGLKSMFEYRYMLDKDSFGQFNYAYINDAKFPESPLLRDYNPKLGSEESIARWHMTYNHSYTLPNGFEQKAKLKLVRDLRYIRDFDAESRVTGEPALENRVSLSKNSGAHHFSVDTLYYVNLIKENPMANNRDAVHRLPEIRYSFMDTQLGDTPFRFQFDSRYTNFTRSGASYDNLTTVCKGREEKWASRCVDDEPGPENRGFHPERDVVRTGQRLITIPALSMPFHAGRFLEFYPKMSYTHQQYNFAVDPQTSPTQIDYSTNPYRRYVTAEIAAKTKISKIYGDLADESKGNRYKHQLEPEVMLQITPFSEQSRHPFFGPLTTIPAYRSNQPITNDDVFAGGVTDYPGVQFDYYDRLYNRNVTGFALNNYITRKRWSASNESEYMRTLRWSILQFYDLDEAKKTESSSRRPWSNARSILDLRLDNFNTNSTLDYFPYHKVANVLSRARLFDRKKYVEVSYNIGFNITEVIPADYQNRNETLGLGGGFITKYFRWSGRADYSLVSGSMQGFNTIWGIQPPGDCMALEVELWRPLGLGDEVRYNFRFSFKFDS